MSTIEQKGKLQGRASPAVNINGNVQGEKSLSGKANGATSNDYEKLVNLPSIEDIELKGNKSFEELGLEECSNLEIDSLFRSIF